MSFGYLTSSIVWKSFGSAEYFSVSELVQLKDPFKFLIVCLNAGCPKKFARISGTVHCCLVVKFCFSRVSDKTGNNWSKDIFIQTYN